MSERVLMTESAPIPESRLPSGVDTHVSHVARIWNYWLGGKENFAVDRQVSDRIVRVLPDVPRLVRASRYFLHRAVRYLAGDVGIDQFLDIGSGLPTAENTHEIAQRIIPRARVVYVDNDPLVLAHARALLVSTARGACDYVEADLRNPEDIVKAAAATLDFGRPIALLMIGVMEFITDDEQAHDIVHRLLEPLPPGSFLVMHNGTNVVHGERSDEVVNIWNAIGSTPLVLRSPETIHHFFGELQLVDPGLVSCNMWRPEPHHVPCREVDALVGVGRKA